MVPVMPIATAALGLYQTIASMSALNKLKKQALPSYTDPRNMNPLIANRNMYQQRFDQGLSPEETASYQNNVRSSVVNNMRGVSDMFGRNAGGALAATVSNSMYRAASDLAKLNAAVRQNAMSGVAGANSAINAQFNRQTAQDYNYRMAQEQAYGKAMNQGLKNIVDPLNFAMMTGQFGGGKTPTPGTGTGVDFSGVNAWQAWNNPYSSFNPIKGQQTWGSDD